MSSAEIVDIPNANFRAAVEAALGMTPGTPITSADMTILTSLEARNWGISDLTGLELATNLTRLNLSNESLFETFEPVQPVEEDTVSVGGGCECHFDDLRYQRSYGSSAGFGASDSGVVRESVKSDSLDGRNNFGDEMASGVRFYYLSAGDYSAAWKLLVVE